MNAKLSPSYLPPRANVSMDFSNHRNVIGRVFKDLGLTIASHEHVEALDAQVLNGVVRPNNYIVLEHKELKFFLLCPLDDQSGILHIPFKYKSASDYVVCFTDIAPYYDEDDLQSLKKRFKRWSKDKLSNWLGDSTEYIGASVIEKDTGIKLEVRDSGPYLSFSFDFYSYYAKQIFELYEAGLKFILVPEYGDGSAIALYRNYYNFNNHPEQPLTQGVVPIYIPMMNVFGFGELAVQENIYTMSLSAIANLVCEYPHEQCFGVYPGDYSLFDKFPSLLRQPLTEKKGVLHRYHSISARNLELDRVFGSNIAKDIGFNTPKYTKLNLGVLSSESADSVYDSLRTDLGTVAVKRINDSFLTILDLNEESSFSVLKAYNDSMDLFLQEYIGDQSGELNLMFLIAGKNIKSIGFSCETNRLLPNNSGGKVGNCSTYHLVGDSYKDTPLENIMSHYEGLMKKWLANTDNTGIEFYGWVDVTLLAKDGATDITNPENYMFVEWMVRNAVDNFSVLVSNMETSYLDALDDLAHDGEVDIKWRDGKEFIVGYDMFQVNFVTPNTISFIEAPENFIPVDSGVGTHIICTDMEHKVYMSINSQDLTRLGNFNTSFASSLTDYHKLGEFETICEKQMSHVPNIAYRGNLINDWISSLLHNLMTH